MEEYKRNTTIISKKEGSLEGSNKMFRSGTMKSGMMVSSHQSSSSEESPPILRIPEISENNEVDGGESDASPMTRQENKDKVHELSPVKHSLISAP